MKALTFSSLIASLLLGASAGAQSHTGYCRYGEDCGDIVSMDIDEAREICSRNPFAKDVQHVRQRQADGSIKFIGYVCVVPESGS